MNQILQDCRSNNIQVLVRIKPESGDIQLDEYDSEVITVAKKSFQYDYVFPASASQQDVFTQIGQPLIKNALLGFNGCVFAYGQTGSGKTHTLIGNQDGLLPKSLQFLFASQESNSIVKGSYLEIYNEHIYDLLADCISLQLREDIKKGTFVQDLTEIVVSDYEEALSILKKGHTNRHIAYTKMNSESSRSHAVFLVQYSSTVKEEQCDLHLYSKINFVDLAGSERQKTSQTEGQRLKEASSINKSLSALGTVISALNEQYKGKQIHIPYRDSKLTNLLKDCLGGNSKTYMIAAITPSHIAETLSTLKFADRVKQIKTKAQINREYTGEEITKMQSLINTLKREIIEKNKQLELIQPSDALQSQLRMQFDELKQILHQINQSAIQQNFNVETIEGGLDQFAEKKSIILKLLKNLDIKLSEDTPCENQQEQFELENKLRTELLFQEEVIYKLQRKKKELEQKLSDYQEFQNAILKQQQKHFDEQMKIKDDFVEQLKDDIETIEIDKVTLHNELEKCKDQLENYIEQNKQFQLEQLTEKTKLLDFENQKNELIEKYQIQLNDNLLINQQLRQQFENINQALNDNQENYQHSLSILQQQNEELLEKVKQMQSRIIYLEQENQSINEASDLRNEYDQCKQQLNINEKQLKKITQEFQLINSNNELFKEEIERLEHQLQILELNEDSLKEENTLYRNTINQLQTQVENYQDILKGVSESMKLPIIEEFDSHEFQCRLQQIMKSKQKCQQESYQLKAQQSVYAKQIQMKDNVINDLQSELLTLQKQQKGVDLQVQLMDNERNQKEQAYLKKISEMKFEAEKMRSSRISLMAKNQELDRKLQEYEKMTEDMIQKLREYITDAFRKNRILNREQQQYYLKSTDINQKKTTILECLLQIILIDQANYNQSLTSFQQQSQIRQNNQKQSQA